MKNDDRDAAGLLAGNRPTLADHLVRESLTTHDGGDVTDPTDDVPEVGTVADQLEQLRVRNTQLALALAETAQLYEASRANLRDTEEALRKSTVEYTRLCAIVDLVETEAADVWRWMGDGDDPESLTCPVVMSAAKARRYADLERVHKSQTKVSARSHDLLMARIAELETALRLNQSRLVEVKETFVRETARLWTALVEVRRIAFGYGWLPAGDMASYCAEGSTSDPSTELNTANMRKEIGACLGSIISAVSRTLSEHQKEYDVVSAHVDAAARSTTALVRAADSLKTTPEKCPISEREEAS